MVKCIEEGVGEEIAEDFTKMVKIEYYYLQRAVAEQLFYMLY